MLPLGHCQEASTCHFGAGRVLSPFCAKLLLFNLPLSDMTRTSEPETVCWTPQTEQAFQALKMALTISPILRNADFQWPFLVHMDVSETSLGAVPLQEFNGEEHPIIYISRKLFSTERCYFCCGTRSPCHQMAI